MTNWKESYMKLNNKLLLQALSEENDNLVTSALSLYLLLGLATNATNGKTRTELKELIAPDMDLDEFNDEMKKLQAAVAAELDGCNVNCANAVIMDNDLAGKVLEAFKSLASESYNADFIAQGDGDLLSLINAWANDKTNGMIPKLLDEAPPTLRMALMNAICFEAEWEEEYDDDDIWEDCDFYNADGSVSQVTMLDSMEETYIENEFFTGFMRPYKGCEYSFVGLLPKKKNNGFIEKAIENTDFAELFDSVGYARVSVRMPEFEIKTTMELSKMCSELGCSDMFTPAADFSGMLPASELLMVDSILQKAYIKVNREGTKAAAVSAMMVEMGCAFDPDDFKEVVLDRPFVYAVVKNDSTLPIFMGVVNQL